MDDGRWALCLPHPYQNKGKMTSKSGDEKLLM